MGLSFRKSIKVGPMRVSFSKSGVGVSAGVKGFRIGSGPRGNYVSVGGLGVRFRQSLGRREPVARTHEREPTRSASLPVGEMREIESGDIRQMIDSSASELLAELNDKRRKIRLFPFVLCLGLLGLVPLLAAGILLPLIAWVVVFALLGGLAEMRDVLKKTTVVFYDLAPEAELAYERLLEWIKELNRRAAIWHIRTEGKVLDSKYHAGAGRMIERARILPKISGLVQLKANIDYPIIPVGRQQLIFLPERLLVFDKRNIGAVSYADLHLEVREVRFIESERLPRDAEVIDHTWKFANKSGGPDRRFKDNCEIPIVRYEAIHFKSQSGLNELIQISSPGVGEPLAQCIHVLAQIPAGKLESLPPANQENTGA